MLAATADIKQIKMNVPITMKTTFKTTFKAMQTATFITT